MNKHLLVIARYQDERQEIFEKHISPKNKEYCHRHGMEYILADNSIDLPLFRGNPTWWKFSLLNEMLDYGSVKDGDMFVHFDADMVIVKPEYEYTTRKSFSYAIDNGNTHCMGNYCMKINDWTVDLVQNILSEELWEKNKDSPHWIDFREQAAWYSLCGIQPHSFQPFSQMKFNGFSSLVSYNTLYSPSELLHNVEIKTPKWNTTLLESEADDPVSKMLQQYNINRTIPQETIIRHFAGGQPWREEYFK